MVFLVEAWGVMLSLAPWLLLGAVVAGLLHVALPAGFVHRELGGRLGVLKAVALGVPLPLCSCGVIPAALGLRRDGAGRGATVGFLISTPQTGVDSALVSASFLGWPFALFKIAAAAVTGIAGGYLAGAVSPGAVQGDEQQSPDEQAERSLRGMASHSISILRTIWRWIAVGVLASAAISTWVPPGSLAGLGSMASMLAVLAVSVPLYVCATGSVPIAAALVAGGLPAGSALVFLMAGPATNVATIGAVYRALGGRTLAVYLGTIVVGSIAAGLLFDSLLPVGAVALPHHGNGPAWWELGSALLLTGVLACFALGELRTALTRAMTSRRTADLELAVEGMTCNNCRTRLETALLATPGVKSAVVVLEPGGASVWGDVDEQTVREAISEAGYTPLPAQGA